MDYKLHTLTNEELRDLRYLIDKEEFNRKKRKEEELTEAFEKAWKDIKEAGLNIYLVNDDADNDTPLCFYNIYIEQKKGVIKHEY